PQLRAHQTRKGATSSERSAARTGQGDLREELCFGHANFGIRRDQNLLGLANIRPSLQKRRWHPSWDLRRKRLLDQSHAWLPRLWRSAKKNADGIFFLSDLSFEVGNLRVRRVQDLLGLQHVQFGRHAVLHTKVRQVYRVFLSLHGVARDLQLK